MHEDLGAYDFSWKPEVIIINLGTNDAIAGRNNTSYTEETYKADAATLLDMVRKNNPDAEIIWVYGMMLTERRTWIQAAVEAYAENDDKVHYLQLNGNTAGRGDHPDLDGQTTAAQMLIEALCELMGWEADPAKDPVAMRNKEKIATAARIQKEAAQLDFTENYCPACGEIDGWTKLGSDGVRAYPGTTIGSTPHFTGDQHFYWDPADHTDGKISSTLFNWLQTNGASVCLHLNGIDITYTGRIHWGGSGTLNIMGEGSLHSLGKASATSNPGNLYINAGGTINLHGGTFTSDDTITLNKPTKLTDARYATLSVHNASATVNIYDGVALESTFGANIAADIGTVNLYCGTLRGGKGYPYHADVIDSTTTDWETCGGNVYLYGQSDTKQAVFNMYGGTITGGTAKQGGNVFVYENAQFNLYGGDILSGAADTGANLYVDDAAAFQVGDKWSGSASVAFQTEYSYGSAAAPDLTFELPEGKTAFIDFGGMPATVTGAGTLCGMDTGNDAYVATNGNVTVADTVQIQRDVINPVSGKRYVALTEEGVTTFHALSLRLSAVTLRTEKAGIYYKAELVCDVVLKAAVASYGVAVSIQGMPDAAFETDESVVYTQQSGAPTDAFTSGSVFNIFRSSLSAEKNAARGAMKIYAIPYLKLADDTVLTAQEGEAWSLQDVMNYLNENYASLEAEDQENAKTFYETWADTMVSWNLANLATA